MESPSSPSTAAVAQVAAEAVNQTVYDNFVLPLWVGLLLGCIGYIANLLRQRSAIRTALLTDINVILPLAREIKEYLEDVNHQWLQQGFKLTGAPVATSPSTMLFTALLPELHLLPKKELKLVLSFYRHYELCESLTRSLYERIGRLAEAGQPLTEANVHNLGVRRKRICVGYASLVEMKEQPLTSISELPTTYAIPSTRDTLNLLKRPGGVGTESPAAAT